MKSLKIKFHKHALNPNCIFIRKKTLSYEKNCGTPLPKESSETVQQSYPSNSPCHFTSSELEKSIYFARAQIIHRQSLFPTMQSLLKKLYFFQSNLFRADCKFFIFIVISFIHVLFNPLLFFHWRSI